jgi:hypothetical protein
MHSLTSELDGGEWSASHPRCFNPSERAPVPMGQEDNINIDIMNIGHEDVGKMSLAQDRDQTQAWILAILTSELYRIFTKGVNTFRNVFYYIY